MIELIAAPSPLGLRPPEPGSVPGTAKAPEALREAGLYRLLESAGAVDGGVVITADEIARNPARAATAAREIADAAPDGYWLHLDVDVLDPSVMAAVDSPTPDGLQPAHLVTMLGLLTPGAVGAEATILDPDLDPDGSCAATVCRVVVGGLEQSKVVLRRP